MNSFFAVKPFADQRSERTPTFVGAGAKGDDQGYKSRVTEKIYYSCYNLRPPKGVF